MKLIPEQVSFLRREIKKLQSEIENYEQIPLGRRTFESIASEQYTKNKDKKDRYLDLLKKSEYVRKPSTDEIGIGTKFTVQFDDEDELENYILVEERLAGNHIVQEVITSESPIGQKIIGKKEGESFGFGTIVKIQNDRNDYFYYIRDTEINSRITKTAVNPNVIEEIQRIIKNENPVITNNQKQLLEIEFDRITRAINAGEKNIEELTTRLNEIKTTLVNSTIANPTGDVIETGAIFNITLFMDDQKIDKRVQLIEKAVSDELEDEYIEKISQFGVAVSGLKNQGEFTVCINGKTVLGVVSEISNNYLYAKTANNAIQKIKGV